MPKLTWTPFAVAGLLVASLIAPAHGEDTAGDDGFVTLFNGQNLDGWKANENPQSWSVEEGAIVADGPRSHLFYVGPEAPFKDFHFIAEVKTTPGSNGGIYFHTKFQEEGWPRYGHECQVNITHSDPKKTGSLYAIENVANPPAKDNEWYTQEIIVKGKHVVLKVNGEKVVDYTQPEGQKAFDEKFERLLGEGTFALQAHDPQSKIYFRNLRVKPL